VEIEVAAVTVAAAVTAVAEAPIAADQAGAAAAPVGATIGGATTTMLAVEAGTVVEEAVAPIVAAMNGRATEAVAGAPSAVVAAAHDGRAHASCMLQRLSAHGGSLYDISGARELVSSVPSSRFEV